MHSLYTLLLERVEEEVRYIQILQSLYTAATILIYYYYLQVPTSIQAQTCACLSSSSSGIIITESAQSFSCIPSSSITYTYNCGTLCFSAHMFTFIRTCTFSFQHSYISTCLFLLQEYYDIASTMTLTRKYYIVVRYTTLIPKKAAFLYTKNINKYK